MTETQGRGVVTMSQLIKKLSRLDPRRARLIIDEIDDAEISEVLDACSAARVAQKGEVARDVFDESVARRLAEEGAVIP